ncbi:MAG: SAM-dependent methyltransferase [Pseudomonadota bacterium]
MIAATMANINPQFSGAFDLTADGEHGHSRPVSSNQPGTHKNLSSVVRRHLDSRYLAPIAPHNRNAFKHLQAELRHRNRPLIIDAFCGSGHSTSALAQRHPEHLVVGLDQSASRLSRQPCDNPENCLLLRCQSEAIWQQLADSNITADYQYLLYPNPWPKSRHLRRRVHAHPAFPLLLAVGGQITVRSNWPIYVEEFAAAMKIAGRQGTISALTEDNAPLTLFERKYQSSGHRLWEYQSTVHRDEH